MTTTHEPGIRGNTLWYRRPAADWTEALPLGNGHLGAMVFGGAATERIALNHENLWRGITRDRTTTPVHQHLAEVRQAFFDGNVLEASEMAHRHLGCKVRGTMPYQPFADLTIESSGHDAPADYYRRLDLANGMSVVSYHLGDTTHVREGFVSAEHGIVVLRLSADATGAVSADLTLRRIYDWECQIHPWADGGRLGFRGHFVEGMDFAVEARVLATGGTVSDAVVVKEPLPGGDSPLPIASRVSVRGANEVLVVLTMAVDYAETDPVDWCRRHLDGLPVEYETLRAAHVAEHRALFDRVVLELVDESGADGAALPTDERLSRVREGQQDLGLIELVFQYGRYLLMSSSRRCDQPANLRGIWNDDLRPPWDSDFHHDIDLQEPYWLAEAGNLAECAEPLIDYLVRVVPQAQKAARDLYNCRGIWIPLTSDVWNRATPCNPGWDVWTGAAAWLAQHLWWHYEYGLDVDYLRDTAYPFIKEVAAFYEDYLVRDPQGRLVPVPSQSPENHFVGGTTPVSLCAGATSELEFIHDALSHAIAASEVARRRCRPA